MPGRIKIGVSRKLKHRLNDIGKHMDPPPVLLGSVKGTFAFEQYLHERLAFCRLKGEWFIDCREVRDVMDKVLSGKIVAPKPKVKSPVVNFVPHEQTPEEWLVMFNRLVAMVYPGDPAGLMASDLELQREDVSAYLTGQKPVPVVVSAAFASRLTTWMLSDLK